MVTDMIVQVQCLNLIQVTSIMESVGRLSVKPKPKRTKKKKGEGKWCRREGDKSIYRKHERARGIYIYINIYIEMDWCVAQ